MKQNLLKTKFCRIDFSNPTVLASGILGTNSDLLQMIGKQGAGAVTTKSIGPKERLGNKNPSVIVLEHGLINSVGLPSAGIKELKPEFESLKKLSIPLIASIYGSSADDYVQVAKEVSKYNPDIIELNISCPNKKDGLIFGVSEELAAKVVKKVKKATKIPVMPKLTPNCTDIAGIAKACEKAGADAICAINTLKGMAISIDAKRPILANKIGGLSGPAIKPLAVRCVYEIYEAVKIPILGVGGITDAEDAIEMMMAGASLVGLGSAVYYGGPEVFSELTKELQRWMEKNKIKSIKELVGKAHKK